MRNLAIVLILMSVNALLEAHVLKFVSEITLHYPLHVNKKRSRVNLNTLCLIFCSNWLLVSRFLISFVICYYSLILPLKLSVQEHNP